MGHQNLLKCLSNYLFKIFTAYRTRTKGFIQLNLSIGNWERTPHKFADKDLEVILECKKLPIGETQVFPITDIKFLEPV